MTAELRVELAPVQSIQAIVVHERTPPPRRIRIGSQRPQAGAFHGLYRFLLTPPGDEEIEDDEEEAAEGTAADGGDDDGLCDTGICRSQR